MTVKQTEWRRIKMNTIAVVRVIRCLTHSVCRRASFTVLKESMNECSHPNRFSRSEINEGTVIVPIEECSVHGNRRNIYDFVGMFRGHLFLSND